MDPRPCITAIIVTYNSQREIADCLRSLHATAGDWLHECLIADNASADGTADFVAAHFQSATLTRNVENLGYGRAINRIAPAARGEFLLILNPDTVVQPGAIAALATCLDHRPQAAACGPQLRSKCGAIRLESRRGFPTPAAAFGYFTGLDRVFPHSRIWARYLMPGISPALEMRTDALSGSCMLVRRDRFLDVGGFDEDYFLFGEDIDLCWKLHHAGGEIWYVPSAIVTHIKGASMRQAAALARREFYRSMRLFMRKRLRGNGSAVGLRLASLGVALASLWGRRSHWNQRTPAPSEDS